MLSAKRSRHRISVALVASCLAFGTQPATICTIVCLSREAAMRTGHHGDQMSAMAPCHTGYGVTAPTPHAELSLVALPASGRFEFALAMGPRPTAEPATFRPAAFSEIQTPPPRLG